jgi:O-antigen ligase
VAVAKPGEAVGNLRQRNQLASLTSIGLAAALWLAARGGPRRVLVTGLAIVLLAAADAATTSRTGLLEWVVILALAAFWQGPGGARSTKLASLGLVVYAAATWSLPILLENVTGVAADSMLARLEANLGCSSRRVLWGDVLQLIPQHPWFGWGWGELDYAHYMHLYGDTPRFCDILDNAHNLPLHVAVELGVPAALLLCAAIAVGLVRARPWRESHAARQLAWLVLSVLALHSLVEYPLWYGPFQLALGLALGLLAGKAVEAADDAQFVAPSRVSRASRALVAVPLVALLAYTAWDYDRVSQIYLEPEQRRPQWREHTLAHIRRSWLFANQARFAELTLADVTRANAMWVYTTAQQMLHYSPEPRVIERLVESATMLGRDDEALLHLARFRAAFPVEYAKWKAENESPRPARSPG